MIAWKLLTKILYTVKKFKWIGTQQQPMSGKFIVNSVQIYLLRSGLAAGNNFYRNKCVVEFTQWSYGEINQWSMWGQLVGWLVEVHILYLSVLACFEPCKIVIVRVSKVQEPFQNILNNSIENFFAVLENKLWPHPTLPTPILPYQISTTHFTLIYIPLCIFIPPISKFNTNDNSIFLPNLKQLVWRNFLNTQNEQINENMNWPKDWIIVTCNISSMLPSTLFDTSNIGS